MINFLLTIPRRFIPSIFSLEIFKNQYDFDDQNRFQDALVTFSRVLYL